MPIQTQTIPPAPGGMNPDTSPWAIPEDQCRMAWDALFDKPNEMRSRGPVQRADNPASPGNPIGGGSTFTKAGQGIIATENPQDVWKVGVLNGEVGDADSYLGVLASNFASHNNIIFTGTPFDASKRYQIATSPHPWGGTFVGVSRGYYGSNEFQAIGHWYGAGQSRITGSGGKTATVNQNGTTVSFTAATDLSLVEPGHFFFADPNIVTGTTQAFIGIVKSVNDAADTVTLMDGALFAVTAKTGWSFRPFRPLSQRIATGLITSTTGSTTVTGTLTKFKRQNLGSPSNGGKWCLFRADDMEFIGSVDTVASDIQLTLNNNALVKMDKDKYIAIDALDKDDLPILGTREQGFITAHYAGRQWYANRHISSVAQPHATSRLWFSDIVDPEAMDFTADGDHFPIQSSEPPLKPITGLWPLAGALVVFKEDETYAVFGTDPTNFAVRRIIDDGALTGMVAQPFQEGVLWAGKKGIWFFDGQETHNMLEGKAERYYKKAVQDYQNRLISDAWSLVQNKHYIVNIEGAVPPFGPVRDQHDTDDEGPSTSYLTMVINLETLALSLFSNFAFRGAVRSPADEEVGTLYLVNSMTGSPLTTREGARICAAEDLFDAEGPDTLVTEHATTADRALGPDFYFESRRYDCGDPEQKKLFKQLMMSYKLQSEDTVTGFVQTGDTAGADYQTNYLDCAVMVGHNSIAVQTNSKWRVTRVKNALGVFVAGWANKRIKFLKRSQVLGFRFWVNEKENVTTVRIGPMSLGFKMMRPGRP